LIVRPATGDGESWDPRGAESEGWLRDRGLEGGCLCAEGALVVFKSWWWRAAECGKEDVWTVQVPKPDVSG
jgi:hypothetical protein